ncbi:MAG: aldo/keto reductase [Gammaproteobacteria bacterium]|nr:aldo/keto reductase [Gammaproteobacteria bacterium]
MQGRIDRRTALQLAFAAGVAWSHDPLSAAATPARAGAAATLLRKAIPSSGELLPVIGVGTNNYSPTTAEERAARLAVLQRFTASGLSVIDTAPLYRESERTIGELLAEIGNRPQTFIATKVTAQGGTREEGVASMEESMRRLRTSFIELMQVHNLIGAEVLLPLLGEWVAAKRIRYTGITTSRDEQYPQMLQLMRTQKLDFIQVDYSLGNRGAAEDILPLAADKGVAVLVNLPFGGRRDGNLFSKVRDRALPEWAAEFDARSWGQFFLKYVVSHPAVTCAIPGMTKVTNLEDNLGAAIGRLPDAATRRRMEAYWDGLG